MLMSPPSLMDTFLSQPASAPLITTYITCSTPLDLADSFLRPSTIAPIDLLDMSASSSAPSKKRKSITDPIPYQEQLAVRQSCWMQLCDASSRINSTGSLPQWSNKNYSPVGHLNDNHACVSATEKFNDLEDVLNFLCMEDDTASTAQSDASLHEGSSYNQYFPLLRDDVDWENCSTESSSNLLGESSYDGPLGWDVIDVGTSSKEAQRAFDLERVSWQNTEGETYRASTRQLQSAGESSRGSWWQQRPLQGGIRASWQDGVTRTSSWQGGIRASWQDESRPSWQGRGARASWQSKRAEGGSRASWPAPASCTVGRGRALPSDQSAAGGASSNSVWAGPTLMDIESALALSDCSNSASSMSTLNPCSGSPTPSSTSKQTILPFLDLKALLSEGEPHQNQAGQSNSWRLKLQKRNSLEPKHTIKVENEENALGDGYRWRKYGQKSIKNSPFPRSYYRCSTGKCSAKKQIEKCQDEKVLFLVTYEGMHLHHKPNMLHKFRMPAGDVLEDKKEKCTSHETLKSPSSPSSSTSYSHSIPSHN